MPKPEQLFDADADHSRPQFDPHPPPTANMGERHAAANGNIEAAQLDDDSDQELGYLSRACPEHDPALRPFSR